MQYKRMPELPEVETIARNLRAAVNGACIIRVDVPGARALPQGSELFVARVEGACISGVRRRGKLLMLDLAQKGGAAYVLAVHLRMTGRMHLPQEETWQPDRHTHVVLHLQPAPPAVLVFHDVRRFGSMQAFTAAELEEWPFYATLGPEPLELDAAAFVRLIKGRSARIKALLLDQHVIAGIGNIYADESLFRAGIRPTARADRLSRPRLMRLHAALRDVLEEAIGACGSSIRDYRNANGDAGAFQNCFRVYGRAGQPCLACGKLLQKGTVAGRTSVYCPSCQKS